VGHSCSSFWATPDYRTHTQQIVQNTGTHIVLRQASADDAEAWARVLGNVRQEELSRRVDGGKDAGGGSTRWVRNYQVQPEDLMVLGPGDAIVQVAALGRNKPRLERVRLAEPTGTKPPTDANDVVVLRLPFLSIKRRRAA
jgi:hypothetical protein